MKIENGRSVKVVSTVDKKIEARTVAFALAHTDQVGTTSYTVVTKRGGWGRAWGFKWGG